MSLSGGVLVEAPILLAVDADTAAWRTETLLRAGYDAEQAGVLAERGEIDLHLACRMLAQGCPVATALRILL